MDQIYNGILLIHKKNGILPFAETWMDLEVIILSKSEKNTIWYHIYEIKNMIQMNWFIKQILIDTESNLMVTKGVRWARIN